MSVDNSAVGAAHAAPTVPRRSDGLSLAATIFAGLCVFATYGTANYIRDALAQLESYHGAWEFVFWASIVASAILLLPAMRAIERARHGTAALNRGDLVEARVALAKSRENALLTFGWGTIVLIALFLIVFVLLNKVAVGKTFFYLPLMISKFGIMLDSFWTNIVIFMVAEVLVLIWGLVVAVGRLLPGPAGQPIRALCIIYCDVFRGMPAIVTLYLVGFGLPLSGLPDYAMTPIADFWLHMGWIEAKEVAAFKRIPLSWYCILALTLTYGAYVAEVYRAGIESIHWSQVAAARSLGLSYFQTLRYVVVPQAVRRIMAPLLNDFIGLQKDTALVQVIGVMDVFNQSRVIASNAFNLSAVTVVAFLFVLITIPQARIVDKMIERDNARIRAGG